MSTVGGAAGGPGGLAVNAGVNAAIGVAQMIQARKQNKEAKELQKNFVDADYEVEQQILDNQALAENRASQGLSDQSLQVYRDNTNRTMTASIDAILRGGGNVNSISDLYDSSEDNFAQIALLEDEVRRKNTAVYMAQNEKLASELEKEWQIDEYAPAQDKKQLIAALRNQANDNRWKGLNTIGSAVGNYVAGNQLQNEINNVYGRRNNSVDGTVTNNIQSTPVERYETPTISSLRENPAPRINIEENSYLRNMLRLSGILNRPR